MIYDDTVIYRTAERVDHDGEPSSGVIWEWDGQAGEWFADEVSDEAIDYKGARLHVVGISSIGGGWL